MKRKNRPRFQFLLKDTVDLARRRSGQTLPRHLACAPMQRTFALIKPDAVAAGKHGAIIGQIEKAGLRIVAIKSLRLNRVQAIGFYHVHSEKPFFADLINFMCEGPIVATVFEHEIAISKWRELMGPTNPAEAPKYTIRGQFGTNIERNAVHGSDALDTAAFEIGYFFSGLELSNAQIISSC